MTPALEVALAVVFDILPRLVAEIASAVTDNDLERLRAKPVTDYLTDADTIRLVQAAERALAERELARG